MHSQTHVHVHTTNTGQRKHLNIPQIPLPVVPDDDVINPMMVKLYLQYIIGKAYQLTTRGTTCHGGGYTVKQYIYITKNIINIISTCTIVRL